MTIEESTAVYQLETICKQDAKLSASYESSHIGERASSSEDGFLQNSRSFTHRFWFLAISKWNVKFNGCFDGWGVFID